MIDESLIRFANTPDNHFLLQPKLKAINDGLVYTADKEVLFGLYTGYVS
jgi:hypothetical protein